MKQIIAPVIVGACVVTAAPVGISAAESHDACVGPAFRAFDFMVGKWDIVDGSNDKVVGHTTIEPIENGCALLETFSGVTGRTGRSLNIFDPVAQRWSQDFVGLGIKTHTEGVIRDGVMHMDKGSIVYLNRGVVHRFKGFWKPLPNGDVDNIYYEQDPKASHWTIWFHSIYRKAA